jgi:hypothetical protein
MRMGIYMLVNLKMIKLMEKDNILKLIIQNTKVNL